MLYIPDADIGSPKSLHTLFDKYLDHMLYEIGTKSYGPNYTKFWAFWQKKKKWLLPIFNKVLMPFWKFLWLKQLFDAKLLI